MRDAGLASKASPSPAFPISNAGSRNSRTGRDLRNSSRHRCRERADAVSAKPLRFAVQRPAPMEVAPPILTQVSEPSTLTKPGPKVAQGLPLDAPFSGRTLSEGARLSGL